ncbi:MAG TPA: response regulator [Candidatus Omnitrophota bacterium]|nr:response regulator [Candidatus Omnitrophota bacterium]HSA31129.1 response regulator [Candidatus Omnitrophota bacterium]
MERRKILIVDDEPEILQRLKERLERDGFDVLTTASGRDAIIQTRIHLPDLILVDIVLPDMDGAEVVRELHNHPATVAIPAIFLSGIISENPDSKDGAEIMVAGRTYTALGKPFTYRQLKEKLDHLLSLME